MGAAVAESIATQPSNTEFINFVREKFDQTANEGEAPALVTSPDIRPFVRGIVECFRAEGSVFVQSEIHPRAGLEQSRASLTERSQTAVSVRLKK
jgi:flagellar biosynthesis protein FlhA